MKRAKFENLEKQREFFIEVKDKLGMGAKKLANVVGLKSRGTIESYTFMRTAPPVEIIKKLEKISGVKAKYEIFDGKVYRKKRGFVPLDPKDAENILRKKFGKDFVHFDKLIRTKLSIKEITEKIRENGYSFNNSVITRCIGSYRTNLILEISEEIIPKKEEIILNGYIARGKSNLNIRFNLKPLLERIRSNKMRVKLQLSKDRKNVRITPLDYGHNLSISGEAITISITEKSELKNGAHLQILINPEKFGFDLNETMYDKDSENLVKYALKKGFKLDNHRNTPLLHKGDVSLYYGNKNLIIEITKAIASGKCYFKVGQLFLQKTSWPEAEHFFICKKKLLPKNVEIKLKEFGIRIIHSNFEKGWENAAIENILNNKKSNIL